MTPLQGRSSSKDDQVNTESFCLRGLVGGQFLNRIHLILTKPNFLLAPPSLRGKKQSKAKQTKKKTHTRFFVSLGKKSYFKVGGGIERSELH